MKRLITICLVTALVAGGAGPARASCAPPPSLPESLAAAGVVFTGTVVEVRAEGRVAIVLVDEVWKGGPLEAEVEVHGGSSEAVTSVDRTYERGDKYLFVPVNRAGPFQDNICTATREYSPELEGSRPLDGSAPVVPQAGEVPVEPAPAGPGQGTKALILAICLAAALAAGYALRPRGGR